MRHRKSENSGHSLVEMLVSMAILLLVVASVISATMLGESSGRLAIESTDQNQQLRAAMQQITEDFAIGRYRLPSVGTDFSLDIGQPVVSKDGYSAFDWSAVPGEWKGDLAEWVPLSVDYALEYVTENGVEYARLKRTVWYHSQYSDVQYGQTYVIAHLERDPTLTYIHTPSSDRIQIRLSMRPAGVNRVVSVYGEFYARPS